MKLIECKLGPAEPNIAGTVYTFVRDRYGRHVASVDSIEHIACLLAVEHYREVPPIPPEFDSTAPADDTAALAAAEAERLTIDAQAKAKADAEAEEARLKAEAEAKEAADEAEREAARRAADEEERNRLAKPTDPILVKGIGPSMKSKLADAGITTLAQIAALSADDEARLDADLKLKGAIDRDNWIGQAKDLLAAE